MFCCNSISADCMGETDWRHRTRSCPICMPHLPSSCNRPAMSTSPYQRHSQVDSPRPGGLHNGIYMTNNQSINQSINIRLIKCMPERKLIQYISVKTHCVEMWKKCVCMLYLQTILTLKGSNKKIKVRLKLLNKSRRFKNNAKIDEIGEYFVSYLCALNQTTYR